MPAVVDVVEFLGQHPPFDGLEAQELDDIAALTEIEFHASGQTVLTEGAGPLDRVRVVRTGSIELSCDGQLLDLLGEGEVFGQASMMSGLPAGFTARAAEDSLVYSLPTDAMQALLARPGALRFLVRSVMIDPVPGAGNRPPELDPLRRGVGSLLRMPLVSCREDEPIREVARTMTERNVSAMLVAGTGLVQGSGLVRGTGSLCGIVTDTDLRSRVVAAGLDSSAPVSAIMTAPVHTVDADRLGGDVLLEMIELGVRHVPVLGAAGHVLGVLEDHDLVSAATRAPFVLRRKIDRATSRDDVVEAAANLGPTVTALRRGGADAAQISALWSVVVDTLTRRLIRLAVSGSAEQPAFTWLALGSLARREAVPSSDVDSALTWPSENTDPTGLLAIAAEVGAGLAACGLRADSHQVSAADPLFARPLAGWQRAARSLLANPEQPKALLLTSVLADNRAIWGRELPHGIAQAFVAARSEQARSDQSKPTTELLLRMLARYSLVNKPPTGFLRDFVVESGGGRRGHVDLKRSGVLPIVDLARWAGLRAGVVGASTPERLRAASAAGTLRPADAQTLLEAFEVISEVRMDHQVAQLETGVAADDLIRPAALSSIARAQLKETFRAVAGVQRGIHSELALGAI